MSAACWADAGGIVVAEGRVEALALVGVAQAEGEIELVGDVEDVVREEGVVAAVLRVDVGRAAAVVDPVEPVDGREDDRRGERRTAAGRRGEAARRGRRVERRERAAGDEAAGGEAAILSAEPQIVGDGQVLVGEIGADQPVEPAVEGGALRAAIPG